MGSFCSFFHYALGAEAPDNVLGSGDDGFYSVSTKYCCRSVKIVFNLGSRGFSPVSSLLLGYVEKLISLVRGD